MSYKVATTVVEGSSKAAVVVGGGGGGTGDGLLPRRAQLSRPCSFVEPPVP